MPETKDVSVLIVGRVVDLADGKTRVATFPTPRLSRTDAVLRAAQTYVRAARRATVNRDELDKAFTELRDAVDAFERI